MPAKYTKDQYWKIYKTLPQELKEAVFSNETAEHISAVCEASQIEEGIISKVAAEVGDVLMGITLPKNFQAALEQNTGLQPAAAQSIAQGINRLVFYPAKASLEEIHRHPAERPKQSEAIGIATPRHAPEKVQAEDDYTAPEDEENPPNSREEKIAGKPQQKTPDQYRESTE